MSDTTESTIGGEPGPAAPRASVGVVALSTVAALLAGGGVAVQTSINGHINVAVGSPILATAINHGSGLAFGLLVALAIGSLPRAWRSVRARRGELRWWWFLGGFMGATAVVTVILATPALGVVTVAVAITLGQLGGSVLADSTGLGPGGRRGLTLLRIAGIALAIVAIVVGSIGRFGDGNLLLVLLVVVSGVAIAIQQAANGWIVVVTGGEWASMTVFNFLVSGVAIGAALLVQIAVAPPDFGAIPWWAPIGGLVGAANGVVIAITVRTIGVLTSMLCIAAGQSVAAILADLLVPVDAVGITPGAIVAAVLAVAAVGLAGLGSIRRRRAPGGAPVV